LGYLASSLQAKGFEVILIDALVEGFDNKENLGNEWFRVGLSRDELKKRVSEIIPDFVGISAQFTSQHEMIEEAVEDVRLVTNVPIVVGGIHATFMPEFVLNIRGVNYVLRGEAEESLPLLLNATTENLDKVPGLSFRGGKNINHNPIGCYPDVTRLPFPARELYPIASSSGDQYSKLNAPHGHKFNEKNLPYYEMITSRGCNYKCAGCAGSRFAGSNRTREANEVLGEIEMLVNKFGMRSLAIIDDNFIQDKMRAAAILKEMVRRKYNLNMTFPNGLLIRNLFCDRRKVDKKFIDLLRMAGTTEVDLPIETASPRIMKTYLSNKYDTTLNLGRLCEVLADKGIKVAGYFMLGFPYESKEEMESTIELAQRLKNLGMHNAWVFLVSAFPGSAFWQNGKHFSREELRNLRFRMASELNKNISPAELQKIREEAQQRVDMFSVQFKH
jgi:radical SAM superfamily enzyme YgiQ (UPF0313 family)